MVKNPNMARDMKNKEYVKIIKGKKEYLERIALMYEELRPNLIEEKVWDNFEDDDGGFHEELVGTGNYRLILYVKMEQWNKMVKYLCLKRDPNVRMKREWTIEGL